MTRIRAYRAEDAPALARIFRAAIHSTAARAFFEKRGFEPAGIERVERAGVIIERYRMRRILDDRP